MTRQQQRRKAVKKISSWSGQGRGSGVTRDEFKLHPVPLAAALLLTPLFNFLSRLATAQLAPAVWLCPSFCQSLCLLLQTPVIEYFVRLPLHSQMDALSAPAVRICLLVWQKCSFVLHTNEMCPFQNAVLKSVIFLHSWWLCQKQGTAS